MGLLRDLQTEIEQRGLTGGAWKADTLALRSRFMYTPREFRRFVRPSLTSLINSGNAARRCRFVVEKNTGKGGKVRKTRPANR